MKTEKRFDELDYGTHFVLSNGKKCLKIHNMNSGWLGFSVWYQDDYGNKNKFNDVGDDGRPMNVAWDEKVTVIPSIAQILDQFEAFTKSFFKSNLDNLSACGKVIESDSAVVVDDDIGNKNKQIESSKTVKTTFNTLTEAVVAAINELKAAGKLSAYQVTQLIRQKTN